MGIVLRWPHQAGALNSSATGSGGYRSGRNSDRGTPETRSTAKTRSGGTSSHCPTACTEMSNSRASAAGPPTALMARLRASFGSSMIENSSIALGRSQATLHCLAKGVLYDADMSLGKRIKAARERLQPRLTQRSVAEAFGITEQAVSSWERDGTVPEPDKLPKLRKLLKVPFAWLLAGSGEPPNPDDPAVRTDDLLTELYAKPTFAQISAPTKRKRR